MDTTLCLAWYYVCTALKVSSQNIQKFYEPIFYTYIIAINITATVLIYANDVINIRHWSPYCGMSPIPSACWDEEAILTGEVDYLVDCVWPEEGDEHPHLWLEKFLRYSVFTGFLLIVLAMMIVIIVVCRNERKLLREEEDNNNNSNDVEDGNEDEDGQQHITPTRTSSNRTSRLTQTHRIMKQAIMYILAYIVTWILLIIPWDETSPEFIDVVESVLIPLGGFWNMLIFVYTKILLVRDADDSIDSNYKAFMKLIREPDSVPEMVIDGMDNVDIADRPVREDEDEEDEEVKEEGTGEASAQHTTTQENSSSSRQTLQFASNLSAYDDLSNNTPSAASRGLLSSKSDGGGSKKKDTDENVYQHYDISKTPEFKMNLAKDSPARLENFTLDNAGRLAPGSNTTSTQCNTSIGTFNRRLSFQGS